jgi:hypothetical protein
MEIEWRAGVVTKKALSEKYQVSRAAIDNHWAKLGIERDLTDRIRQEAQALVTRASVTREVTPEQRVTERETVQAAAQLQADYIFKSRKDITKQEEITAKLIEELETCGDDLGEKVKINKALAETRKILIGLQRQALNIQDNSLPAGDAAIETIRRLIVRPDNG